MYGLTRGQINNNPLNIRISSQTFEGEIVPSKDPAFKQFQTPIYGIRAGAVILGNYYKLYDLSSIAEIIQRWAPATENDTDSYMSDVSKHMGISVVSSLDLTDPSVMASLVKAMIYHENGVEPYSDEQISQGVTLALNPPVA